MQVKIGKEIRALSVGNNLPFFLIAGPCQLESRDHCFEMAHAISEIVQYHNIPLVFKTSFDKANRTSILKQRGIGIKKAIPIFAELKEKYCFPIITDIHESYQCDMIREVVDIIQIPAFLSRQTDLLIAAAQTGLPIHVKKAQFLSPWDMKHVIQKIENSGNSNILLCERGTCFGYQNLVSDMRSLYIMKDYGYPVVFDATHSVQQPGGLNGSSGGQREFVEVLARAALSLGIAGLFIETHQDPDSAPSDGPNMIHLHNLSKLLSTLKNFDEVAKKNNSFIYSKRFNGKNKQNTG